MDDDSLRGRMTRQGEEAIGRFAQDLLENPVVSGALTRAFETRERAMRAQEVAMGALNLPSAADLERLTRRVRSVSQRLEGIEDGLDRLDERLQRATDTHGLEARLRHIEELLERLTTDPAPGVRTAASTPKPRPAAPKPATPRAAAPKPATPRAAAPKPATPQPRAKRGTTRRSATPG